MYVIKETNTRNYVASSSKGRVPLVPRLEEAATFKSYKNAIKAIKLVQKRLSVRISGYNFFVSEEAMSSTIAQVSSNTQFINQALIDMYTAMGILSVSFEVVEVSIVEVPE